MSNRATFTLEDEAFDYLNQVGSENKSAYVNHLLLEEKKTASEASHFTGKSRRSRGRGISRRTGCVGRYTC